MAARQNDLPRTPEVRITAKSMAMHMITRPPNTQIFAKVTQVWRNSGVPRSCV